MSGRVVVVGSINVDLVVRSATLPVPGETVTGGRFARHHGGKGGNQAVAAARLGTQTAFVGAIGEDAFGAAAREALAAEGIDLRGLVTIPDAPTGVALILVETGGDNSIAVASGANLVLSPEHVEAAFRTLRPGPADVVLAGHEIRTDTTATALRLAREAGAATILNPAPADGLDPETLALADVLTPNRGELATLTGDDGPAAGPLAARLLDAEPARAVVVTLGADGALLVDSSGTTALHGLAVEVVDTVGAGDTFNGALAAGMAHRMSIADA